MYLTDLGFSHKVGKKSYHRFKCKVCEREITAYKYHVLGAGKQKACTQRCTAIAESSSPGEARSAHNEGSSEWRSWNNARRRCTLVTGKDYPRYGGRGIKMAEEWGTFEQFLKDMGRKPTPTHTLDRIDPNGDYCKENCRWATVKEQMNNRRCSVGVDIKDKCEAKGIPLTTYYRHLRSGRDLLSEDGYTYFLSSIKGTKAKGFSRKEVSDSGPEPED